LNPPQKQPKSPARALTVAAEIAGQRLDNYLLAALRGVPRSHVYRLIRSGQVRVNSGRVSPSYRLKAGDRIRVPPVAARPKVAAGPDHGLDWLLQRIVFEDERVIVLDKPAGLAVHGGSGVALGCIEALRALKPELKELELAHRLDRATSGCLLVAKRRSALRTLHGLLRDGAVDKRYLALVRGRWPAGTTEVDAPLATRHAGAEARVRVDRGGKPAATSFTLVESFGTLASLVEARLATGRTHQIRVHAAHSGHPLAGDDRYGDGEFDALLEDFGLRRMFLHAHSIAFRWPDRDDGFAVSAPLPADLAVVLTRLEERAANRADRDRRRRASARAKSAAVP
jgi:23S rRNA pseudouridine955/2504/2580 synthase